MLEVSDQFKAALNVSHTKVTQITVTVPNGDPVNLQVTAAQVSSGNDSGTRYTARLDVVPQPGVDLYSILSTPGAVYRIHHGIDFGPNSEELIDMGVYEASAGSINIIDGDIAISLVDRWSCLERARFIAPTTVDTSDFATRAELISALVDTAFFVSATAPDGIVILNGGGSPQGERVFERDRTQAIKDLATDGSLDVYFNASGEFVIREQPIIDPGNTVWTFRTGPASNVVTADRERPFDRLYNAVSVNPIDQEQTWSTEVLVLEDTTNPRHPNNVGEVVPYFYSSPTISSQAEAAAAANTILQRIQGTTETVSISGLGAPMLEVGDSVTIAHEQTFSDPGFNAVHIIDSWDYDLLSGSMTLKTRSDTLAEVEEG